MFLRQLKKSVFVTTVIVIVRSNDITTAGKLALIFLASFNYNPVQNTLENI